MWAHGAAFYHNFLRDMSNYHAQLESINGLFVDLFSGLMNFHLVLYILLLQLCGVLTVDLLLALRFLYIYGSIVSENLEFHASLSLGQESRPRNDFLLWDFIFPFLFNLNQKLCCLNYNLCYWDKQKRSET
jgi:hypothetical protein